MLFFIYFDFLVTIRIYYYPIFLLDLPGGSDGKASAYNAGDLGSIPGSERSPGEGNGNPLQYSYLENPMDGGTWLGFSLWGRKESDTTELFHSLYLPFGLPSWQNLVKKKYIYICLQCKRPRFDPWVKEMP